MESEDQAAKAPTRATWKFDIGAKVEVDGMLGEVVWRRENAAGQCDYEVRTEAGQAWHPEADVK